MVKYGPNKISINTSETLHYQFHMESRNWQLNTYLVRLMMSTVFERRTSSILRLIIHVTLLDKTFQLSEVKALFNFSFFLQESGKLNWIANTSDFCGSGEESMLVRKGKHFKKYFKTFTYWAKGGKRKEDLQKKKGKKNLCRCWKMVPSS